VYGEAMARELMTRLGRLLGKMSEWRKIRGVRR